MASQTKVRSSNDDREPQREIVVSAVLGRIALNQSGTRDPVSLGFEMIASYLAEVSITEEHREAEFSIDSMTFTGSVTNANVDVSHNGTGIDIDNAY